MAAEKRLPIGAFTSAAKSRGSKGAVIAAVNRCATTQKQTSH